MDGGRLNLWLGIALIVAVTLNLTARTAKTRPNFEYFPNMARTARYNPFEENSNFADGATLRAPVPGTVPRGTMRLTDVNPFSPNDRDAVARGATVFTNFCQPCHGADAKGVGPVVRHGFAPPPPLSRTQTQEKTDAQLFQVVTEGVQTMPGYGPQLSQEDRWKVILHVRAFRR
jgi:mono/diheme cytochrome c family protein